MDADIRVLLDRYIEGVELAEAERDRLSAWVTAGPENVRLFVELLEIDFHLSEYAVAADMSTMLEGADLDGGVLRSIVQEAVARRNITQADEALGREMLKERARMADERLRLRSARPGGVARVIVIPRLAAWGALAAVLTLLVVVGHGLFKEDSGAVSTAQSEAEPAEPVPVAWVVQRLDVQWEAGLSQPDGRGGMPPGEYGLLKGKMKMKTAQGVGLVVTAPARFTLPPGNGLSLTAGQVAATVADGAEGFYIDTPSARVVDYGTEFGVLLDSRDVTVIDVYDGEVRSSARIDGKLDTYERPLYENQAIRVSDNGRRVEAVAFDPGRVPRRVSMPLEIVDMVCGGDGTGDQSERGIHPGTGQAVYQSYGSLNSEVWQISPGDQRYSPVSANAMIDGVFVIGPDATDLIIDSTGTHYPIADDEVQNIVMESAYGPIWATANGRVPTPSNRDIEMDRPFTRIGQPALDRRFLILHASVGLTIDLDAVRSRFEGMEPNRFHAMLLHAAFLESGRAAANFTVLIDGREVLREVGFESRDGVIVLDTPIPPDARFLTLISTCGADGSNNDWVLLSEPTIQVEPLEADVPVD